MRRDYEQSPKEIQEHGMDFHWDNTKLWELDVFMEEIHVSEIDWVLDLPFWDHEGEKYNLCPRRVLENMDAYPEHKERILKANLSHPIDLMENRYGRLEVIDGMHRLVRLMMGGNQKIKVRKIPREFIPLIEN